MADAVYPGLAAQNSNVHRATSHSGLIRAAHWVATASFFGLLVSGIAILFAHPRFYWGETGTVGTPSLFDLPLPFILNGQTGWGRSLHFLSAWVCVLTGAIYLLYGVLSGHFRRHLLPSRAELAWRSLSKAVSDHIHLRLAHGSSDYNVIQRLAYLAVIFLLFPLAIWTGLAMSPAVVSAFPAIQTVLGGQQSARTIHFFVACLLTFFLFVHVAMISVSGFTMRMREMTLGSRMPGKDRPWRP